MTTLSVLDAARETPHGLAIADGDRRIDFHELAERVRARMQAFAPLGDGDTTSLVAVQTDERLATIESLLALIELERPFLPLHPRLTPGEREQLLERVPATWLIGTSHGGHPVLERRPLCDERMEALLRCTPQLAAIATSGSSGSARLAVLSRRAFVASAEASAANLGWYVGDSWLLCLPVAHIGGLSVLTRCLLARRPIVLAPARVGMSSTESLASGITQGRPSLLSLVPTQLHGLLEREPRFEMPSSVRAILTGGAAASPRLLDDCAERGWPVLTSYGLTEACSQVATQRPGTTNRGELGSGRPLPGVRVRLDDGVICISGPTVFGGYIGAPPDEAREPESEFRTRDLGRFDADGNLHVLGRIDDLIISGGENVLPREVEEVLEACPGVLEACVFGIADPHWGEIVAAGLRLQSDANEQVIDAVQRESQRRLAAFKQPRFYACATQFTHGPTGKLDRRATARELQPLLRPIRPQS